MPAKWSEVIADPDYQSLPPQEQQVVKERFYTNVVAKDQDFMRLPPEEQAVTRQRFEGAPTVAAPPTPTIGSRIVGALNNPVVRTAGAIINAIPAGAQAAGSLAGEMLAGKSFKDAAATAREGMLRGDTPFTPLAELAVGSPRTRTNYTPTVGKELSKGLIQFAGDVMLPLSVFDMASKVTKAVKGANDTLRTAAVVNATSKIRQGEAATEEIARMGEKGLNLMKPTSLLALPPGEQVGVSAVTKAGQLSKRGFITAPTTDALDAITGVERGHPTMQAAKIHTERLLGGDIPQKVLPEIGEDIGFVTQGEVPRGLSVAERQAFLHGKSPLSTAPGLNPEQMAAMKASFEEATHPAVQEAAKATGTLLDKTRSIGSQISARMQKITAGKPLQEELAAGGTSEKFVAKEGQSAIGGSNISYKDMPMGRPSNDITTIGREFAPTDRTLRKTGALEIVETAQRARDADYTLYKDFLAPFAKQLEGNKTWRANVTTALDTGNLDVLKTAQEREIYQAFRSTFNELAARQGIPRDRFIKDYLTHMFEPDGFYLPQDLQFNKSVREVHSKFLLNRAGGAPVKLDAIESMQAYLAASMRQIHMQPAIDALNQVKTKLVGQPNRQGVLQLMIDSVAGIPVTKGSSNLMLSKAMGYIGEYSNDLYDAAIRVGTKIKYGVKQVPIEGGKFNITDRFGRYIMTADNADEASELVQNLSKFKPGAGSRAAVYATQGIYRATIGANIGTAVRNLGQSFNTLVRAGVIPTLKGIGHLMTEEGREVARRAIGNEVIAKDLLEGQASWMKKIDDVLFYAFNKAEFLNRGTSFWAGVEAASKKTSNVDELITAGMQTMADTQFLYGVMGRSPVFSHPITRPIGAFLSFPLKQANFMGAVVKDALQAVGKKGLVRAGAEGDLAPTIRAMAITGLAAASGTAWGKDVVSGLYGGFFDANQLKSKIDKGWNPVQTLLSSSLYLAGYGTKRSLETFQAATGGNVTPFKDRGEYNTQVRNFIGSLKILSGAPLQLAGLDVLDIPAVVEGSGTGGLVGNLRALSTGKDRYDIINQAGRSLFTLSEADAIMWTLGLPSTAVNNAFDKLRNRPPVQGEKKPTWQQQVVHPSLRLK